MRHALKCLATYLLLIALTPTTAQSGFAEEISFGRDVRPILSDKCYKCHGPDENTREADLRLDQRPGAEHVLSSANPSESEFLRRITSTDADERMPPSDSKIELSTRDIEVLSAWIRDGAPFEQHWSFTSLKDVQAPIVQQKSWLRNPIDRFILARLEREGLTPSAEASREKLIRRATFDLTGLPPTLDELEAFIEDDSEDAYEKLVDDLLARSTFGERMASHWLDVARYSDSYGYQVDRERFVWPWRDWVIRAFNDGLPYDDFVTWQLAGDLLPDASDDQILATTFSRLHSQKVEGGSTPEEFRIEYVADRTHTFATAFLGLTLECARCHRHKFDPITHQEYYQFFAFFNNIDESGLYSYRTKSIPTPTLLLMNDELKEKVKQVEAKVIDSEEELTALADAQSDAFATWLSSRPQSAELPGRLAHLDFESYEHENNQSAPGKIGKAVKLTGDDGVVVEAGNFRRDDTFSIAFWMQTPDVKKRSVILHKSGGWTDAGSRGYQLLLEEGKLSASLIHFWPGNAIRVRTKEPIETDRWVHVAVTYDGSSRAKGLRIFLNGKITSSEIVRDKLRKEIGGDGSGEKITIGERSRDRGFTHGLVDEFHLFERELAAIEVRQLHDGESLTTALTTPVDDLDDDQRDELFDYYLRTVSPEYAERLKALKTTREERSKTVNKIDEIMVMRELPDPRPTFLLKRGAYDAPAERVEPRTPEALTPLLSEQPANRLGLARWLTSPEHPLTSRVAVNRFWQMCFGQGLVRTPEDFGSQGETPTHPALLDWLAKDFIDNDWNVRQLLKLLVTSATYRQNSVVSPDLRRRDPDNRLWARANLYRLPAEMIRDNALAVSGLLVEKRGGPPVRPYEVEVSFKPMKRDEGEGLYRRSLYTFWKRTGPAPVMMAFDASKRDVCVVKRERTSSPLQAIVLLNDPQFVEAANHLAQRLQRQHGDQVERVINDMFRLNIG